MDKLGDYPIWLVLYIVQYVWPMVGMVAISVKVLWRNGKDMRRELLGVSIEPPKTYSEVIWPQTIEQRQTLPTIKPQSSKIWALDKLSVINKAKNN